MESEDFGCGSLWAIRPGVFGVLSSEFHKYKSSNLAGAAQTLSEEVAETDYPVVDRVAVLPIAGAITKNPSPFSFLFGGCSILEISEMFRAAVTDPKIDAIVLDIDSPGGTIQGINDLSRAIYKARGLKPIVAYGSGSMSASAFWLGSAATKVVLGQTSNAGSIGVMAVHEDLSAAEKMAGKKTTYIASGKYKTMGNASEPLSDDAREMFQKQLDYVYKIFVDDVARNRGVSSEAVQRDMADGRNFIGQQAVDAGLVDCTGNISTAIDLALNLAKSKKTINPIQAPAPAPAPVKENLSTIVDTPHPGAVAIAKLSIEDQAKQDFATKQDIRSEFRTEGAYVAFQKAFAEGKVHICRGGIVKLEQKPGANSGR